jgi:hypothetical protein
MKLKNMNIINNVNKSLRSKNGKVEKSSSSDLLKPNGIIKSIFMSSNTVN